MANTITKFQAQYLKERLETIKEQKVDEFRKTKEGDDADLFEVVYAAIKSGKLKMRSITDVRANSKKSYRSTPYIDDLFDTDTLLKNYYKNSDEIDNAVKEYRSTLSNRITEIVDSVVLQGLGIEEAIAQFKRM